MSWRGMTRNNSRGGRCAWGASCECFEQLEPRIVLSDMYYAWTGVEILPGFVAEYGVPDKTIGVSDNGQYFWSAAAADRADDDDEPYLVAEGRVWYLRDIEALVDAEIAGINSHGVVLATDGEGEDFGRVFVYDLGAGSGREYLDEAGLVAPSGFDVAAATPRFITDGGGVVLTTGADWERRGDQWAVIDGTVAHLWSGIVTDVNASDWAIGLAGSDAYGGDTVLWHPEQGLTNLTDQGLWLGSYRNNSGSGTLSNALNNDGTVFLRQWGSAGMVLWRNGEIVPLDLDDQLDQRGWDTQGYYADGRAASGVLGVIEYWSHDNKFSDEEMFVVHPDRDVYIQAVAKHDYKYLTMTESGILLNAGRDLRYGEVSGGWYDLVDRSQYLAVSSNEGAAVWMENGEMAMLTRTANGERMRFNIRADGTVVYTFGGQMGFDTEPWLREAIADPATGKTLVLSLYRGDYRAIDPWQAFGDVAYTYTTLYDKIHSGVTGFFDEHGWPVIAGLDENTQLLMAYGEPQGDQYSSLSTNLSTDHLAVRGQETPAFVGGLDSFRTRWGARNIVGLDANGEVHAVWWSPGLGSALWTTSNLSTITGAPKLVGELAATATPWGGMQVMGTDERGHLISLWWSPAVGGWRVTDLTEQTGGATLEPGSFTVHAGGFGGISVVGKSTDNDVVTYWWSPRGDGAWEVQSLRDQAGESVPLITGPVSYFVALSGEQHVAGATADGHVIDLYWKPGQQGWQWRDLTAMVDI